MSLVIIYPCMYGKLLEVEPDYKFEEEIAEELGFDTYNVNFDDFVNGSKLKVSYGGPKTDTVVTAIYRGWMMTVEQYTRFYNELLTFNIKLVNTPEEYENTHHFINSYSRFYNFMTKKTPKAIWFDKGTQIDWYKVRNTFDSKFIVKDYVKSVKGFDFPEYLETSMSDDELNQYIEKFIQLRGDLYQGGIILKQYVELDKSKGHTHEFRAFYSRDTKLCVYNNSNNKEDFIPKDITKLTGIGSLESNLYTVDFARLSDGSYTVIEIGDGQVSGLPSEKEARLLYEKLKKKFIKIKYKKIKKPM